MEVLNKRTKQMTDPDPEIAEIRLTEADIFTIPLVTDCIFNHLEYSDLLSCSLVSQAWNSQARDYLRRQRTSLLKCKIEAQVDSLQQLLDHLSHDDNNSSFRQLFTGVHVWIEGVDPRKLDVECANTANDREIRTSPPELMSLIEDWQGTTRTQLTKLFGLFPVKHLVVTVRRYCDIVVRVIFFALDFIFPLLPDCQVETLKINGRVFNDYAKILWKSLPIKGSPKLKTVRMGGLDYDLPLETERLVGEDRFDAINGMIQIEHNRRHIEIREKERYYYELSQLKKYSKRENTREEDRARYQSRIALLTRKLQDLAELETL